MDASHVLLADIGGTNARFALAEATAPAPLVAGSAREYAVADFPSLADAARTYLEAAGAKSHAMVAAVAGRIDGDEARITNFPWVISIRRTRQALGLERMRLVNDFTAQSMAVLALQPDQVAAIGPTQWSGRRGERGNARTFAVIGPGTGLGVGGLLIREGRPYPLATEGGHVDFAPGTPEEIAILQQLAQEFGRVSIERLVSGMGLVNLHRALSRIAGIDPGPMEPRDVSERAAQGDPLCMRAVDVFCAAFGAIAGDLVLTLGAWDGVFLSGGLVPKLLPTLQHSGFRQRFEHKGRFSPAMAQVPTLAVMHPQPGLLGCAVIAVAEAAGTPM
ncbi:glucokinase [Pseudoluteimonas lycopersici]|uniref:Glucokinase n=1 Tax=Pseudoluteimonas lycopersici TaxID=1324796 RepID=A0A516V2P1_9GAMM|nr:glucokinase [Lysobacter lycopersici]QDQ72777.1 glucokinase [Lysobacter lycopersici]